jgi:hypothetical protein
MDVSQQLDALDLLGEFAGLNDDETESGRG